jgi:nitrate/nitrite transporter NarK
MGRNHGIMDWNPEDAAGWEAGNKNIARRNLFCTVAADHVAFSIWTLWPVMALFMPASVYGVCSAIDALGGVGINLALRQSYLSSGTETSAYWIFLASDVAAAILTWMVYVRRPASVPGVPETLLTAAPVRV